MDAIVDAYDGELEMIDTSSVRVHQHGATTKKGGHDRRMGRSRGGVTTKACPGPRSGIHAVVDGRGLPLRFGLTPGQAHDTALVDELLGALASQTVVIAYKAYDANGVRQFIEAQGAATNIPDRRNREERHCFSRRLYRSRNHVERFFNRIKHLRRIATRYEKYATNYPAMLKLAAIPVWLRHFDSVALSIPRFNARSVCSGRVDFGPFRRSDPGDLAKRDPARSA